METSIIHQNILRRDFPYDQPWFYNHPYALRCELDGDTSRALEIYRMLFPHGADALFFDYFLYDDCASGDAEEKTDLADVLDEIYNNCIESRISQLQFLFRFQRKYRHTVVQDIPFDADDDSFLRRNRIICYPDETGFPAEALIRRQMDRQTDPLVSFVSFENELIFSIYDDRGCDIVFASPQHFAACYPLLEPYFLSYDRDTMRERFDAIPT